MEFMKFMKFKFFVTALFMSAVFAGAQNPAPTPPPSPAPTLTELEKAKLENINLKYVHDEDQINSLRNDEKDLAAQFNAYKTTVESAHPGFTLGPDGKGGTALVAIPKHVPTAPATPAVKPNPVPRERP